MAETVGLIALEAIGVGEFGLLPIFGIAGAASVATGVGTAILVGGSIGLQLLLQRPQATQPAPGGPALPPPEAGHQPIKQAIPPRIVGLGRVRLAGAYVLFEAKSKISYDVQALHHGRIAGIVGYYLHDDVVTLTGGVVDSQGDGRYGASAITIKTRLGLATETAYSEITTPLSAIWGADYRGDGLASAAIICSQAADPATFANIYPRGRPELSIVADCTPIFDARAGGQSNSDDSTWAVSSNPVLQLMFFLTDVDRGMGFDYATLITPSLTSLLAEATLCDATVIRADGTNEPRYISNGSYPLDSDPADVISSILDTGDIWLGQNGDGSLALKVGVYRAPTITLEAKHIRGCAIQYDIAEEEVVNELTIDYTEPLLDYKTAPGQPWRNEADISERGRVRSQRLALPWVYSHAQARRLAKRKDNQNNASLRGTITTTLYGIRCLGERWVQISAPDLPDLEDVVIEVRGMTIDLLNASCQIKFVSVDPATIDAWNPATEEGASPTIPAKLVTTPPPTPQNISAFGAGPAGYFLISFDPPGRSDLTFQYEYRITGSGGAFTIDPAHNGSFMYLGRPTVGALGPLPTGVTYDIKLRSIDPTGVASALSSTTTINL